LDLAIVIASVISGGIFGDHASPISDTTIISSMASGCEHIEHVRTQLPYALLGAILASISFYLVA
jgi:Na+/H+ antiporter NhaC